MCLVSDCPEGWFGAGCVHPCNCSSAPCDKVTGQCKCPAGTTGKHCENCESIKLLYNLMTTISHKYSHNNENIHFEPQCVRRDFGDQAAEEPAQLVRTGARVINTTDPVTVLLDSWDDSARTVSICTGHFGVLCFHSNKWIYLNSELRRRQHRGILKSCSGEVCQPENHLRHIFIYFPLRRTNI